LRLSVVRFRIVLVNSNESILSREHRIIPEKESGG
jgi:hypothetical protein